MRSGDKDTKAFCAAAFCRKNEAFDRRQAQGVTGESVKLGPTRLADLSLS